MQDISKTIVVAISLLVGGGIVSLAVPNTLAAFSLLDTEPLRVNLQQAQELNQEQLAGLNEAQNAALEWYWSSQAHQDLITTELKLAMAIDERPDGPQLASEFWYNQAEQSLERGLLRSPADPAAWSRLSFLRLRGGAPYHGARDALIMSLLTGAHEKTLMFQRIQYGAILWDQFSADERSLVRGQVILAERIDQARLVKLAHQNRAFMITIVSSMAEDPNRFGGFIRALNR